MWIVLPDFNKTLAKCSSNFLKVSCLVYVRLKMGAIIWINMAELQVHVVVVVQASLELTSDPPASTSKCWDYRHVLLHPVLCSAEAGRQNINELIKFIYLCLMRICAKVFVYGGQKAIVVSHFSPSIMEVPESNSGIVTQ